MSNTKSMGQGVRGLRLPKLGVFPLTLNVAQCSAITCYTVMNIRVCDRYRSPDRSLLAKITICLLALFGRSI